MTKTGRIAIEVVELSCTCTSTSCHMHTPYLQQGSDKFFMECLNLITRIINTLFLRATSSISHAVVAASLARRRRDVQTRCKTSAYGNP